jgi:hypothetical protein
MRCALGFAIRTDDEVCKCLAVSGPAECWKAMDGVYIVVDEQDASEAGSQHPAEAAD